MADSEANDIRVLPDKTDKQRSSSSSRTLRLLTAHKKRPFRVGDQLALTDEIEIHEHPPAADAPPRYGSLEHIRSYKDSCNSEDKSLKKEVREFYSDQLELIDAIESVLVPKSAEVNDEATAKRKRRDRMIQILTFITLATNIVLVIIKIVAAVISKSLSVISSVVDSVVDLLTSGILIWTAHKIKNRDNYLYPTGRSRLEPIAVVILSVIMCSASVQVIFESAETLDQDVEYFLHRNDANSTHTLPELNMSALPIVAMVLTIVSKAVLLVACSRYKNPTMDALAEDNRNDVASNIVALACGLIGSFALRQKIKQEAIVADPVGAILISVYIIIAWIRKANEQVRHLTGLTAEPSFLQRITHVVYNYRPDVVTKIDSVRAVHLGTKYFAEVDIGLPGSMPLAVAHDIGMELQDQLENIDEIERAFVHLDFEFLHMPANEHKKV